MQGHQREALALLQELTRLKPWWHLLDGLALAHWRGGDPARAAEVQRRALESCAAQDPEGLCSALASIRLAEYLLGGSAGEDEARKLLQGALALREKSVQIPPFEEARAHLLLARIDRVSAQAAAHRERAMRLLAPVAHRGGRHQHLLESARDEARPLPPL
jgi:tetratricopeptide (TPR) repeat protein